MYSLYADRKENEEANRRMAADVKTQYSRTIIDPTPDMPLVQPYDVECAILITSYPYGRMRCLKRVWLERKRQGVRVVEQTSDPKSPVLRWNKPHAGTYTDGVVVLVSSSNAGEEGYIQQRVMTMHSAAREGYGAAVARVYAYRQKYAAVLTPRDNEILDGIRDYCDIKDKAEKTPHPKTADGTVCATCRNYSTSCTGQTEGAPTGSFATSNVGV